MVSLKLSIYAMVNSYTYRWLDTLIYIYIYIYIFDDEITENDVKKRKLM